MRIRELAVSFLIAGSVFASKANATLINMGDCVGAPNGCEITNTPPNPVSRNPDQGRLIGWDERQDFVLPINLLVNAVVDPSAPYVLRMNANFFIRAGTTVSSHMLEWDSLPPNPQRVETIVSAEDPIVALLRTRGTLRDSDDIIGLPSLTYEDFANRGWESNDDLEFRDGALFVSLTSGSPGDWIRFVTIPRSVPGPSTLILLVGGVLGLFVAKQLSSRRIA